METKWMLHERGECKPCAYFHHKEDGCRQGEDCEFCHLCSPEALKERKKLKLQRMKADKQLAARQGKNARRGLGPNGRSRLPNCLTRKHVPLACKDGMIINQTAGKGNDVRHDKSDDETTQAPSESEIFDRKSFAFPPGLEHSDLGSTLAMHGLPPSPMCGSSIYGHLTETMRPTYVNLPAPVNLRSEAVSVSFLSL
eukprot:TRINITY_DN5336_c0_g2_i1.p1 TRINITY_DN5336_c0_g2~~TRINITY_DN5336_c0_g2_i1.p1  ORF type:complete len:197 (+),score=32.17 TRINITY_DN5336_c0_g2_i1:128-718(+)